MNFNGGDIIEDQDYLSEASAYTGGGESIGYLSEGDELPQMGGGHNSAWEGGYVSDGSLEGGAFIQDGGNDLSRNDLSGNDQSGNDQSGNDVSGNIVEATQEEVALGEAEKLIKYYNEEQPKIMTIFKDDDFKSDNTEDYKKKLIKYVVMKEVLIQTNNSKEPNIDHSDIINNIIKITTITTTEKRPIKDIDIQYNNNDENQLIITDKQTLIDTVNYNFNILENITNYNDLKKAQDTAQETAQGTGQRVRVP